MRPLRIAVFVTAKACALAACSPSSQPSIEDAGPPPLEPDAYCPGGAGCASKDGELLVGAAKHVVTPDGFEIAKAVYLRNDRPDAC